jgi:hypothetical protein
MTKLLLTVCASTDDIVQLEPTIEALYYQYEDCQITLRTFNGYQPFFEHHPYVSEIIVFDENNEDIEGFDVCLEIPDINSWSLALPISTVEKFACAAGVQLLRKTPKIFLEEYPADENYILLAKVIHSVPECPVFTESLHHAYETKEVGIATDSDDLRRILKLMAAATLVVGPDSWATQAAAALDVRVIMSMDVTNEALRAPFNVVVVPGTKESILRAVEETLFEKRYPDYLNCGNAAEFIKCLAKKYMKAHFVDIGCSAWPIPNGIPVDKDNRNVIEDAPDEYFAGVFSSHCLEHITEWAQELTLWHRVMRTGGAMVLYLPHPRAEVWHARTGSWVGNEHVWNPEPVQLVRFLKEVLGMHIVEYTSRRDPLWSFHVVARKI